MFWPINRFFLGWNAVVISFAAFLYITKRLVVFSKRPMPWTAEISWHVLVRGFTGPDPCAKYMVMCLIPIISITTDLEVNVIVTQSSERGIFSLLQDLTAVPSRCVVRDMWDFSKINLSLYVFSSAGLRFFLMFHLYLTRNLPSDSNPQPSWGKESISWMECILVSSTLLLVLLFKSILLLLFFYSLLSFIIGLSLRNIVFNCEFVY